MADEVQHVNWDWDTIGPRLLAGLYIIAITQLQRFDAATTNDRDLDTLRLQAEELLKRTEP